MHFQNISFVLFSTYKCIFKQNLMSHLTPICRYIDINSRINVKLRFNPQVVQNACIRPRAMR